MMRVNGLPRAILFDEDERIFTVPYAENVSRETFWEKEKPESGKTTVFLKLKSRA
jgi:hypothetical protein